MQTVHDRIAVGGPRSTGWATVAVSAGPLEASPTPLLVVQVSPLGGGEVVIVSHCAEASAVDEAHAQSWAGQGVRGMMMTFITRGVPR